MNENWLNDLKTAISELDVEYDKFITKKRNSAGTKARKLLQDIKQLAQEGRNSIQAVKVANASVKK